jgi:hypothetical protein
MLSLAFVCVGSWFILCFFVVPFSFEETCDLKISLTLPFQSLFIATHCRMTLNCVSSGESGLGKSTVVNSLFLTDLYAERRIPAAAGNR